jgi:hypothetical protein
MVGLFLSALRTRNPFASVARTLRPHKEHPQLALQNGIIAQASAIRRRENIEAGCRVLYRVLAHGFNAGGAVGAA